MPYTIMPKKSGFGLLAAFAYEPRQALDIARFMLQRGVKEVEIIADEEVPPELAEHGGVVVTRVANE